LITRRKATKEFKTPPIIYKCSGFKLCDSWNKASVANYDDSVS
jgi:hypothetical protein